MGHFHKCCLKNVTEAILIELMKFTHVEFVWHCFTHKQSFHLKTWSQLCSKNPQNVLCTDATQSHTNTDAGFSTVYWEWKCKSKQTEHNEIIVARSTKSQTFTLWNVKSQKLLRWSKTIPLLCCLSYLLIIYVVLVNMLSMPTCINSSMDIIRDCSSRGGAGREKSLQAKHHIMSSSNDPSWLIKN